MIKFTHSGNFNRTERFMSNAKKFNIQNILNQYGQQGVSALAYATPKDTGVTASSWGYRIDVTKSGYKLVWTNSSEHDGVPIVILIQYGHGTSSGAYIPGIDFINPALAPILDKIANAITEEVSKS